MSKRGSLGSLFLCLRAAVLQHLAASCSIFGSGDGALPVCSGLKRRQSVLFASASCALQVDLELSAHAPLVRVGLADI